MKDRDQVEQSCFQLLKGLTDNPLLSGFSHLLENIPDAVVVICKEGLICTVNTKTEELFGYHRDEMIGKRVEMLMPTRFHEKHREHLCQYFSDPHPRPMRGGLGFVGHHKDGREIPLDISIGPFQAGEVSLSVGIIRDISARKQVEKEIKNLNETLERKVARRTEQLEVVNKELSAFCYSVSHDLRAPLTGISGFSQVLLEDYAHKLDKQGKEYLSRVCEATRHMEDQIEGLLSLFRVTQEEIFFDRVDLCALSDYVVSDLKERHPDRDVAWSRTEGMLVNGDIRLLRQVLDSLLSNAWKYTGKTPHAKVEFGMMTDQEGNTTFYVRDNGCGFDMNYVDKLFLPFQRLHGRGEFPGNGVGLATVQRIIHRHGGSIWGEGVVDQGATFYFQIP